MSRRGGGRLRAEAVRGCVCARVCVCVHARRLGSAGAHRALQDSSEGNTDPETKKKVAFMPKHIVG